jgi:hypothetical protein
VSDPTSFDGIQIDHSVASWGYDLATRFLEAAVECFDCDRTFVADGQEVEAPVGSGCCQLAVTVTTGLDLPANDEGLPAALCTPVFTAELTLIIDLCVLLAGQGEVLKPDDIDAHASENQATLWQVMQGLMAGRADGSIAGLGATLIPAGWQALGHRGGSARWQTQWLYRA